MVESRTCPRCEIHKPAADFYRCKTTGHGLTTYCKACTKDLVAKRWAEMTPAQKRSAGERQQVRINQRRATDPVFAEALRAKERRWRSRVGNPPKGDREAHTAYMREWRTGNIEAARKISREAGRRYRYRDPERFRISSAIRNANRRAEKRDIPGRLIYAHWLAILDKMQYRCAFCLAENCILDLEHVDALTGGGSNEPGNITCACRPCNGQKHNRTLKEFCALRGLDETEIRARVRDGLVPAAAPPG